MTTSPLAYYFMHTLLPYRGGRKPAGKKEEESSSETVLGATMADRSQQTAIWPFSSLLDTHD